MDWPFIGEHANRARSGFRERRRLLRLDSAPALSLHRREQRLLLHLRPLGEHPGQRPPNGADADPDAAATFVRIASGLLGTAAEATTAATLEALTQGPQPGATDAHGLLPPADPSPFLEAYSRTPGDRSHWFELFRLAGIDLPAGELITRAAAIAGAEEALALARYATERPAVTAATLRGLLQDRASKVVNATHCQYLRGLLLHGDASADDLLGALSHADSGALSFAESDAIATQCLRLLGLSGMDEVLPPLESALVRLPEEAAEALALHGSPGAVEALLRALEIPDAEVAASNGLHRITGIAPPALTGAVLTRWWRRAMPSHAGRDLRRTAESLERHSGRRVGDRLDVLAVLIGRPTGIHPDTWVARRALEIARLIEPAAEETRRHA